MVLCQSPKTDPQPTLPGADRLMVIRPLPRASWDLTLDSPEASSCDEMYRYESARLKDVDTAVSAKSEIIQDSENVENVTEGTVQFLNQTVSAEQRHSSLADSTYYQDEAVGTSLGDFFKRPVKVATFRWTENSAASDQYSLIPWAAFFSDTRVKKKLDNFAYINCKLVIRFAINASPFYYGALKAVYTPLSGYGTGNLDASTDAARKVLQSQRYTVDLNPQEGSTAIMELPFIHFRNWLRAGRALDFIEMGSLTLVQYAALRSANGVTGAGVDIAMYIHAEDVHLSGPTVALSYQSGRMRQNGKANGWISGPASAVAAIAHKLEDAPVIAPFARATDIAASAVSGIAQLFGFTNEPVIEDIMPFKSLPYGNLASGEISEPAQKLTLDPKQELCMDSRVAGFDGQDELLVSNVAQKESFLAGTNWSTAQTVDTILWTNLVTPDAYNVGTGGAGYNKYFFVPMGYTAKLFREWRGDIIYRFKFIRSQYHRGRVRITWDPYASTTSIVDTANTNFTQIVDLEECDEIEIRVPYMADQPFLDTIHDPTVSWSNGPAPALTVDSNRHNGMLQMRVLNNLTAPELTSDVDILVYVRAADNFELAVPRDIDPRFSFYAPQSKREPISASAQPHNAAKEQGLINYGEKFTSLRDLLHRSTQSLVAVMPYSATSSTKTLSTIVGRRMPRIPGFDPNGLHQATSALGAGTKPYNFVPFHPLSWVSMMYIGQRGGVIWNYNFDSGNTTPVGDLRIQGAPSATVGISGAAFTTGAPNAFVRSMTLNTVRGQGGQGMALTNQLTQCAISAYLPQYARCRFYVNSVTDNTLGQTADSSASDLYEVSALLKGNADPQEVIASGFTCTGPDFNLFGWLGVPQVWRLDSVPGPVG